MDFVSKDAGSSSGSETDAIMKKSGCRMVKIAGMTLAGVGLLSVAALVLNHAFTRPKGAHIDQEQLVDFNDRKVHNGLLQRSQNFEAANRALEDSTAGKAPATDGTNAPTTAPSTTPATAPAIAPAPATPTTQKGSIRWATHPEYCFDIAGGRHESGTNLQVWHCNESHAESRQFIMPIDGEGPIHWAAHPEDCIDVSGGKMHNGNNVQMWVNDCTHEDMQFVIPGSGLGPIRWAAHPDKCIDIDGGKTGDATNIKLWDCEDGGEHPNQRFLLPHHPA